MDQIQKALLAYARRLVELSRTTKDADDRHKYEQRLAALAPMFVEAYGSGSQEELRKLVQAEIRREGWDFFPKNRDDARLLEKVRESFFQLFA